MIPDCSLPDNVDFWAMNCGVRELHFRDNFRSLPKLLELFMNTFECQVPSRIQSHSVFLVTKAEATHSHLHIVQSKCLLFLVLGYKIFRILSPCNFLTAYLLRLPNLCF